MIAFNAIDAFINVQKNLLSIKSFLYGLKLKYDNLKYYKIVLSQCIYSSEFSPATTKA